MLRTKNTGGMCVVVLLGSLASQATEPESDTMPQNSVKVRFVHSDGKLFLDGADVAAALDWELKTVRPERLITFCRSGKNGVCIPVVLKPENHRAEKRLFIAAEVLRRALSFRAVESGGKVTIQELSKVEERDVAVDTPAYNADWGQGRGFRNGQTLPDIPLMDMDGREVRFSQFLGKRYILYCWASW